MAETTLTPLPAYTTQCFIPFQLADSAGILFFAHVFTLAHQAYEQFVMEKLGYSWHDWFQNPKWMVPIKHADADFQSPITPGKECRIDVVVTQITNSSLTLDFEIQQQDRQCATVKTVHVFCDRSTKQKQPIPADLLPRLKGCLRPQ